MSRTGAGHLALAAVACLLAVLAATALGPVQFSSDSLLDRLAAGGGASDPPGGLDPGEEPTGPPPAAEAHDSIPPEVVLLLTAAVVATALLGRALLQARRDESDEEEPAEDGDVPPVVPGALEAVADAARRGLDRLEGADAGDEAVLACWVELEVAGGRLGSGRARTDTPTDFAERLAAAVPGLDVDVLTDLRRTYSRVRYGSQGALPDDVARARTGLEHLLTVLEADRRTGGRR